MADTNLMVAFASSGIVGLLIVSAASLRAWKAWLDLKQTELQARATRSRGSPATTLDLIDIKERVRKLEAIASGVDL